jgi:hypothetical protein
VSRRDDLDRYYGIIATLREECQEFRCLKECTLSSGWPGRGVYFIFEDHEYREDGSTLRVVRVGTHAVSANSRTTLWNRLHTHKGALGGSGNHRGSIFRKRVGEALLQVRGYSPEIAASWGIGNSAPKSTRLAEFPLERDVSTVIGLMPLLWLEINDTPGATSDRAYLERNCLALLSNFGKEPIDTPSKRWLGVHSPQETIRKSGLWNTNHVEDGYTPAFFDVLERYVREGTDRPRGSSLE